MNRDISTWLITYDSWCYQLLAMDYSLQKCIFPLKIYTNI